VITQAEGIKVSRIIAFIPLKPANSSDKARPASSLPSMQGAMLNATTYQEKA
jgi:hypothetical protein